MASVITCKCGALVPTNFFSGFGVYSLILDSDYDAALEKPVDEDALSELFRSGKEVLKCKACGRLIVHWEGVTGPPTFYSQEKE
jgi:hypothetical protein